MSSEQNTERTIPPFIKFRLDVETQAIPLLAKLEKIENTLTEKDFKTIVRGFNLPLYVPITREVLDYAISLQASPQTDYHIFIHSTKESVPKNAQLRIFKPGNESSVGWKASITSLPLFIELFPEFASSIDGVELINPFEVVDEILNIYLNLANSPDIMALS